VSKAVGTDRRGALVARCEREREAWRVLVDEVGVDRMTEPGPMGPWSFKDLAAHLLGWRDRTIARLEAGGRGEPEPAPPWPADLEDDDVINTWIHEHDAGRSPEELVASYDASYDRLIAALEALPEALLIDPDAVPWVGGPLVEIDFTGHLHDEHVAGVRAWLDG